MTQPLVRIKNVSLFIPGERKRELVLKNIDWDIFPLGQYALLGANGSGKSTLMRLIHGDLWPASGHIYWLDGDRYSESPIVARSFSAIVSPQIQENCQQQELQVTVREFIASGLAGSPASCHLQTSDSDARIHEDRIYGLMEKLGDPDLLARELAALSQGQLRLALLARALIAEPALLLLDEYVDGLDQEHKQKVFRELEKRVPHMAMIFASHRRDGIPPWVADYLRITGGLISAMPKPADRAEATHTPVKSTGASISGPNPPLLRLENVSVFVERTKVLHNISWNLRQGENWAITGENGSGKSTFLRLLAGDEFVAAGGRLEHYSPKAGRYLQSLEEKRFSARLVSDLGQALYGYPVTALELVCSGIDNTVGLYRDFTPQEKKLAREMLAFFFPGDDLSALESVSIRRLSTGQSRRLHLARALMGQPEILLLDEPCSGLDAASREMFLELLDNIGGKAINGLYPQLVIVSHYEDDFPDCVNRRGRMDNGILYIDE